MALLAAVLAIGILVSPLAGLTYVGARSRGRARTVAVAGAILFPLTWIAWYVVDEHPYAGHHA